MLVASSVPLMAQDETPRSVEDVLSEIAPKRRERLTKRFTEHAAVYPPAELTLIAYKKERRLEVWVPGRKGWVKIVSYKVLAASGERGPKLKEGDEQVPEGVYRLTDLNPNSKFHLSIRVDYPNARDVAWAERDKRENLGGDIFIHGNEVSRGCLAVGDERIEELFTLIADTGVESSRIIIAPDRHMKHLATEPAWVGELYDEVRRALEEVRGDD
jgi:murein L,D-transpeptidase YafK